MTRVEAMECAINNNRKAYFVLLESLTDCEGDKPSAIARSAADVAAWPGLVEELVSTFPAYGCDRNDVFDAIANVIGSWEL